MTELLLSAVLIALSLSAALHALMTKSDSRSALAWVSFCLLMPLLGPAAYILFGINRTRSTAQRLYSSDEATPIDGLDSQRDSNSERTLIGLRASGRELSDYDSIRFLVNGEQTFPAMLADIAAARQSVTLCTYLFQHDQIGRQFVAALSAARARGVEVRVLIDGLGELAYPPRVARALRAAGIETALFDPLRLFPPSLHINLRNHRKMLVVDGCVAYTGGHNISARHLVDDPAIAHPTRDLHARVRGAIAAEFDRAFAADWRRCTGETIDTASAAAEPRAMPAAEPKATLNALEGGSARLLLDGPNEDLDKLNDVLLGVFSSAKTRLWLMTPYFLPDSDLVGALTAARLRGVDVRVLLPARGNVHLAHWAAQHATRRLARRGLPIYLSPAPFIHTKALLIDDDYALIGSANIDPRSLRLNFELAVELFSPACAAWLSRYFENLLGPASRIDASAADPRPYWMRVRDAGAWLFSPFL